MFTTSALKALGFEFTTAQRSTPQERFSEPLCEIGGVFLPIRPLKLWRQVEKFGGFFSAF